MDYLSKFIGYLQATKNLSDKTLSAYNSDLRQFFSYEQNILHPNICSFISYLSSSLKLKDTSVRRKIITLKCFYSYLIDTVNRYGNPISIHGIDSIGGTNKV